MDKTQSSRVGLECRLRETLWTQSYGTQSHRDLTINVFSKALCFQQETCSAGGEYCTSQSWASVSD